MKLATFICAAVVLAGAGAAASPASLSGVIARLQTEGWSDIEVEHDDGRVEIEASRDGAAHKWVYDAWSGWLISARTLRRDPHGSHHARQRDDDRRVWRRDLDDHWRSGWRDRDDDDDDDDDDFDDDDD